MTYSIYPALASLLHHKLEPEDYVLLHVRRLQTVLHIPIAEQCVCVTDIRKLAGGSLYLRTSGGFGCESAQVLRLAKH